VERNVPMYSKTVSGSSTADGIIDEMRGDNNARLLRFSSGLSMKKANVSSVKIWMQSFAQD